MRILDLDRSNRTLLSGFMTALICCVGIIGVLTFKTVHGYSVSNQEAETLALLERAERAILKNRLTTPPDDNAMKYIAKAMSLYPDHPYTKKLVNRVVQRYAALVNSATKDASSAGKHLHTAIRFRNRARDVALSHQLPVAPIEKMDERIKTARYSLESAYRDNPKFLINTLLDSHLHIAKQALTTHDVEESAWHAKRARSLIERYDIDATRTTALERQITIQGGNQSMKTESHDSSDKRDSGVQHQMLTELKACHIETALAYLDIGRLDDALRHQRSAQYLVTQNNLDDSDLLSLTQRIDQQRTARTLPSHRLFGNF